MMNFARSQWTERNAPGNRGETDQRNHPAGPFPRPNNE